MNFIKIFLFVSVCLIWGTTWLAMEIAVESIPPILATAFRFIVATPFLYILTKIFKKPIFFPKGKRKWMLIISVFYFAIPFALMTGGEMFISSGLASIIFSTLPIFVMLGSILFLKERPKKTQIIGLILAIISICTILAKELDMSTSGNLLPGILMLGSAVLIHSLIYVLVVKQCESIHVLTYNTLPVLVGGVLLLIASILFEDLNFHKFTHKSIFAVIYLGVIANIGGVIAYFRLGEITKPSTASVCFLIFPLVAISISNLYSGSSVSLMSMCMLLPLSIGILLSQYTKKSK